MKGATYTYKVAARYDVNDSGQGYHALPSTLLLVSLIITITIFFNL